MSLEDYYHPNQLNKFNYNIYISRIEVRNFIQKNITQFSGSILDLGCGNKPYEKLLKSAPNFKSYVGMDLEQSEIYNAVTKDLTWDGNNIPLHNFAIETVLATELLEHCYDTENILNEIFRVLTNDGKLIGTVPFIWPLHEVPNDFYRFTPFALKRKLQEAGFSNIEIFALGGHNKSLGVSLAIWLQNSKSGRLKKRVLRFFILPIIKNLIKNDHEIFDVYKNNNSFVGLGFIAKK